MAYFQPMSWIKTLFFLAIAGIFTAFGAQLFFVSGSANGWVNATGTVLSSSIYSYTAHSKSGYYTAYGTAINYSYSYNGIRYTGYWQGTTGGDNQGDAQYTLSQYPQGSNISIVVNPASPASSKTRLELANNAFGGLVIMAFGILFLGILLFSKLFGQQNAPPMGATPTPPPGEAEEKF